MFSRNYTMAYVPSFSSLEQFEEATELERDPEPSFSLVPPAILERFHHQIRQHGPELLSFVTKELHGPPSGIAITLERLEWPESQVNWVWFVSVADTAIEQAVLRFFQTDAGRRALVSDGPDAVEFKLATTLLHLPASQAEDPILPEDLTAAAAPLRVDQEVMILSRSPPHTICVPAKTNGWLQVSPHLQFSQVVYLRFQGQARKYLCTVYRTQLTYADHANKTPTLKTLGPGLWIQTHQQPMDALLLLSGLGLFS